MNQRLITLNGDSTDAPRFTNIQNKSDIAAGLIFWKQILESDPDLTWGDVLAGNYPGLSGFFSDLWRKSKNVVGDVYSGFGKIISDTGDKIGDWGGSAIRLWSDKSVQDAIYRATNAFSTGGASEMGKSVLEMFGSKTKNPISEAGKQYKNMLAQAPYFGGIDPKIVMGSAAGLIIVVLLMSRRK